MVIKQHTKLITQGMSIYFLLSETNVMNILLRDLQNNYKLFLHWSQIH